ncbi:hypothetical protein D9619_005044 [Psilocybe cf. subviscida]|uniref:F-box domain-containing protein n=1 Tax=Psilocybe cf. subviscida TaxID=2480587 RepID=A0A8H5F817_9AGAR|nr:hypothetical protein D9619_005044 [Psilocybe cf. subviscida]
MKLFTSLHKALHAVTDQVQSGLKRLRRSSPTMNSSHQATEARPKPKRLRKRTPWQSHKQISDEQTSNGSTGQRFHQLSRLNFSIVDIAGAVTKASLVKPLTEDEIRYHTKRPDQRPELPVEIWEQILGHGIGDRSFLLAFRSLSRLFNDLARERVPRLIARYLEYDQGNDMDFTPEYISPTSWMAVLQQLPSSAKSNDFLMLQCADPGPHSALPLMAAASTRRPTSLIIKESLPYGEGRYISLSINNFIRTRLVRLGLTRSLSPDFIDWNKLQELILECPISKSDAFHLLSETNCSDSLRAATLNVQDSQYAPDLDSGPLTVMTRLGNLTLMGSLSPIHTLMSRFSFPALRDLTLTALGSEYADTNEHFYCELRFPWSQLERLGLRNSRTSLADVHAVLSQCLQVTRFIWGGTLTSDIPVSTISLPPLKQLTLEGDAFDCKALLEMLKSSSSRLHKLALSHYSSDVRSSLPKVLEELIVYHPVQEADLLLLLEQFSTSLERGKFAVLAPDSGLLFVGPSWPAIVRMEKLTHLCLQANHTLQPLLSSLITPKIIQADLRPLPYHLS